MDYVHKQDRSTATIEIPKVKRRLKEKSLETEVIIEKKKPSKKLRKKLLEVAERNELLSKSIEDKNNEIANLRRSVQSLNEVLNSVPIDELRCNSSIASSKIIELSKKNRQLRAELETTKNRANMKELQVQKLEKDLKTMEERFHGSSDAPKKNPMPPDEMHIKLNAIQQKLFETRNKNTELQAQLKLAHRCLQQEVGESFNLSQLISQSTQSNWRGRAQQILHLQQKVHELKERLSIESRQFGHPSEQIPLAGGAASSDISSTKSNINTDNNSLAVLSSSSATSFDRFTPGVRKTEIVHRAKVESLEKEIASLREQLESQRGKILALKVRNKTLNDEALKYKAKASSLEEQTDYNGLNMASINEKVNLQKYQYENRIEEMARKIADAERHRENAEFKERELRNALDNLESLLESKEAYIEEQNKVIKKLEFDLKAISGDFLFSCREFRKEEFIAILDALEVEKNQLMEYNKSIVERYSQERSKNESLMDQVSKYKVRISRLEAKLRDLEKEFESNVERRKRSQRIAEYVSSVSSTNTQIHGSMGSLIFENSALNGGNGKSGELTAAQVADLKNQLEFATEKITVLEEKIVHLSEEKENDAKAFNEILTNTKSIILETITNQRTSNTCIDGT